MDINPEMIDPVDTNQTYDSFDDMNLNDDLVRGIYSYGFEKPSAIQMKGITPITNGFDTIIQAQCNTHRNIKTFYKPKHRNFYKHISLLERGLR